MIKWFDLEPPPFRRDPTDFIPTTLSQLERIQEIKELSDWVHLLILDWFGKEIFHWRLHLKNCIWSATKTSLQQAILNIFRKVAFSGWPHIIPKHDLGPISHLNFDKSRKTPTF
jgi:hypothetical protein